uniref:Uncharacterized protein n=1 Tax=Fagus sylvatica TaxID=28930 RepID=A0A2N9IDA5_FAGSY
MAVGWFEVGRSGSRWGGVAWARGGSWVWVAVGRVFGWIGVGCGVDFWWIPVGVCVVVGRGGLRGGSRWVCEKAQDQQPEPLAVPEEPVKVKEVPVVPVVVEEVKVEKKLVEKVEEKPIVVELEPEAKPV